MARRSCHAIGRTSEPPTPRGHRVGRGSRLELGNAVTTKFRERRRAVLTGVACIGVLVAGCSGEPPTGAGRTSTSAAPTTAAATSSTASAAELARDAATDAYRGIWRAMANAGETSDWRSPELAKYATGDALGVINRSLYTDHLNGVVTKGAPKLSPQVSGMTPENHPTTITISDCGDSSHWLKYKDGRPLNDEPGGRRAITAEVKKQPDGSWKVTRFAVEAVGTCV